jgi:hypothetical protein
MKVWLQRSAYRISQPEPTTFWYGDPSPGPAAPQFRRTCSLTTTTTNMVERSLRKPGTDSPAPANWSLRRSALPNPTSTAGVSARRWAISTSPLRRCGTGSQSIRSSALILRSPVQATPRVCSWAGRESTLVAGQKRSMTPTAREAPTASWPTSILERLPPSLPNRRALFYWLPDCWE